MTIVGLSGGPPTRSSSIRDPSAMLKGTAEGSGQRLDSGAPLARAEAVWGVPAIPSVALPQGQALVGAFAQSCQLFIREPLTAGMTDSDQDDYVKNRVTIRVEMRAGFAVLRPAGLALVDSQREDRA